MAKRTYYTCDRCGKQKAGEPNFVENVGIRVGPAYSHTTMFFDLQADWCRNCLIETGLRDPAAHILTDPPAPDPKPTLEDLIREIIRECIEEEGDG